MVEILDSLFGGLSLGGTLTLLSLGLVLVFRATETFNFAHGQFMLLAATLVAFFETGQLMPGGLAVVVSLLLSALVAVVFFRVVISRLVGLPLFIPVVATLGLSSVLQSAVQLAFGPEQRILTLGWIPSGSFSIGGAPVSTGSIIYIAFDFGLAIGVAVLLKFTQFGTLIRASGQDPLLAAQGGANVRLLYAVSWALAGVLAGIAGISYGAQTIVSPSLSDVATYAFSVIIVGGFDSIVGAVIGGLGVGLLQGFVVTYFGGGSADVVTYAVVLVVLLVLPTGLFGTRRVDRV